jgi:hypothetical protein
LTVQDDLAECKSRYKAEQQKNKDLTAQNEELQRQVNDLTAKNQELTALNDQLIQQNETLSQDLAQCQQDLAECQEGGGEPPPDERDIVPVGTFNAPSEGRQSTELIEISPPQLAYYRFVIALRSSHETEADEEWLVNNGFLLVPTMRWMFGRDDPQFVEYATKPQSKSEYQDAVYDIIEKYSPEFLVVENEHETRNMWRDENRPLDDDTAQAESYAEQLGWAIEVAHESDVRVANGGYITSLVKNGTFQWMKDTNYPDVDPDRWWDLNVDEWDNKNGAAAKLQKLKTWMAAELQMDLDLFNFHFYLTDRSRLPESDLGERAGQPEIVACLRDLGVTQPLFSGEGMTRDLFPASAAAYLEGSKQADLIMSMMIAHKQPKTATGIWTSGQNQVLTPVGEAFRDYIRETYLP